MFRDGKLFIKDLDVSNVLTRKLSLKFISQQSHRGTFVNAAKLEANSVKEIFENDFISFGVSQEKHDQTNRMQFAYKLVKAQTIELDSSEQSTDEDIIEINEINIIEETVNIDDSEEVVKDDRLDETGVFEQSNDHSETSEVRTILTEINIHNPNLPGCEAIIALETEAMETITETKKYLVDLVSHKHTSVASQILEKFQSFSNPRHCNLQTTQLIAALPKKIRKRRESILHVPPALRKAFERRKIPKKNPEEIKAKLKEIALNQKPKDVKKRLKNAPIKIKITKDSRGNCFSKEVPNKRP